ncbi:chromodomain-helicase-DNA-binding, partial [Trifolium medium]|nr:chromodomain-helicase-DNA-binding [Trifolium medium]
MSENQKLVEDDSACHNDVDVEIAENLDDPRNAKSSDEGKLKTTSRVEKIQ